MSDNTELIATARLRAEKYVNGSEAYMLNCLVAAIESAEAERDAACAVVEQVRMKAIALTCLTGHWRGYDFDGGSEFAGEAILEIIKAAK